MAKALHALTAPACGRNVSTPPPTTFEEFQATKRWSDDLTREPGLDLGFDEVAAGLVYYGSLHIFARSGRASPQAFELVIGNDVTVSENLKDLERKLYDFGKDEGCFE
jgi:hypothetical protein